MVEFLPPAKVSFASLLILWERAGRMGDRYRTPGLSIFSEDMVAAALPSRQVGESSTPH